MAAAFSPRRLCPHVSGVGWGWSELLISGPAAPKCHHLTVWSVMPPLETVFRKTWQQAQTSHSTGAQAKKSVPCTQGKRTVLDSRRGSECSPPSPRGASEAELGSLCACLPVFHAIWNPPSELVAAPQSTAGRGAGAVAWVEGQEWEVWGTEQPWRQHPWPVHG